MPPRRTAARGSAGKPQQLSTLAGSALHGTQRNITTLWRSLAKQLPTIRNATHYYAHDVQRIGRGVYEAAANYRGGAAHGTSAAVDSNAAEGGAAPRNEGGDFGSSGEGGNANQGAKAPLRFETEAHYVPASLDELGVAVHSATLQRVPNFGLVLALCIEGGFAVFAVEHDGVYEITVAVQSRERGNVIGVQVVSRRWAVVATPENLSWYDLYERAYSGEPRPLSDAACSLGALKDHIVVLSAEYSQLTVYRMDTAFTEVRSIIADRSVLACSARWLAYCANNGKVAATTALRATKEESTTNTVAKSIADGFSSLKGGLGLGQAQSTSVTLGSVTICDVATGKDFASFNAHEHNIQCLAFDCSGALLATASVSGTSVNVWQVMPGPAFPSTQGPSKTGATTTATVTLLYRLGRGMTASTVTSIAFSPVNAWAALATSVGTVHCYRVPQAQRARPGVVAPSDAETYSAPTLATACRCRSGPLSKNVDPSIAFHPDFDMRTDHASIFLTAASATVGGFLVSDQGVATVMTQHLTQFSAGDEEDEDYDGGAEETTSGGGGDELATGDTTTGVAEDPSQSAASPVSAPKATDEALYPARFRLPCLQRHPRKYPPATQRTSYGAPPSSCGRTQRSRSSRIFAL
jgi:hypothetical protein